MEGRVDFRVMPIKYRTFKQALDDGAACETLFAMRRELSHRDRDRANAELQRIGCYMSTSTRTDEPDDAAAYSPEQYREGYRAGSMDPEGIFGEAGTSDPEAAAQWYADTMTSGGPTGRGAYSGCLDALMGRPNRFPDE